MEGTTTIKVDNGELYVRGDTIVGRKVVDGNNVAYYRGDKLHREGGPAQVYTTGDGITHTRFYRDGNLHNESGPAVTKIRSDGLVIYEAYAIGGEYHRVGAPAVIVRSDSNVTEQYWENGKQILSCCKGLREEAKKELAAVRAELDTERGEHALCRTKLEQFKIAVDSMDEKRNADRSERDDLRAQFNLAKDEISGLRAALESAQAESKQFAEALAAKNAESTMAVAEFKQKIRAFMN